MELKWVVAPLKMYKRAFLDVKDYRDGDATVATLISVYPAASDTKSLSKNNYRQANWKDSTSSLTQIKKMSLALRVLLFCISFLIKQAFW